MLNAAGAISMNAISTAMDVAMLRQQVIAANIANVNTPGYVAKQVTFATTFERQQAMGPGRSIGPGTGAPMSTARIESRLDASGQPEPIHLDQEVAALAQNALHYQVLLKGLNRHFSMLSAAVSEGRR